MLRFGLLKKKKEKRGHTLLCGSKSKSIFTKKVHCFFFIIYKDTKHATSSALSKLLSALAGGSCWMAEDVAEACEGGGADVSIWSPESGFVFLGPPQRLRIFPYCSGKKNLFFLFSLFEGLPTSIMDGELDPLPSAVVVWFYFLRSGFLSSLMNISLLTLNKTQNAWGRCRFGQRD